MFKAIPMKHMLRTASFTMRKHSPEILTGIGVAGMVMSAIMAVKATPKALTLIENAKDELDTNHLTPTETVKSTWKCYAPAVVTGAMSAACIIGASSVNYRRNAALATAYTLSETARQEFRDKIVEEVGTEPVKAVQDAIAKEQVEKAPVNPSEIIIAGNGDVRCFDAHSGRYFMSTQNKIQKGVNEFNKLMLEDMYGSMNDFYRQIDLPETRGGDDLGWNSNRGLLELYFSSQVANDGVPCLVLEYNIPPRYDYMNF